MKNIYFTLLILLKINSCRNSVNPICLRFKIFIQDVMKTVRVAQLPTRLHNHRQTHMSLPWIPCGITLYCCRIMKSRAGGRGPIPQLLNLTVRCCSASPWQLKKSSFVFPYRVFYVIDLECMLGFDTYRFHFSMWLYLFV